MRLRWTATVVAAALAAPVAGFAAITTTEYHAEKGRIEAEFETARSNCANYGGNAGDICLAEANGNREIAMAELEERRAPTSRARYKLRLTRAKAEFDVASEECDERASAAKDDCVAEARAALARELADARENRRLR